MKNYLILALFIPGLFLIFMFSKASFIEFLFGFGLCLLGQTIIILCYCVFKVQQTLLDSTRIKLEQNYELNVEKQYPFKQRKQALRIFLNKYTEQEKLETKKNTLKVHSFQNYLSEEEILSEQPKKEMMRYLKEKKHEHNLYNFFNKILIQFGRSLTQISQKNSFQLLSGSKYAFQTFQQRLSSQIPQSELENLERQILDEMQIKIKIKKDEGHNILFPDWTMLIQGLKSMGKEFMKIEQMHQSNQQILDMVNGKMIEDFQFIESQIKKSLKSLDEIQKTSENLKKQNEEFLASQRNGRDHQMDWVFLLKQQYYKFQDFELRIKDNEKNYHIQTKKLSYFRQKLDSFSRKNRQQYEKIFKTRFFAILDSYNITIQESIKAMRKVLCMNHYYNLSKPPKVNRLESFKNIDQQVEAQRKYQSQYFQRAKYYSEISQNILKSMIEMRIFLEKLQKSFSLVLMNSENWEKRIKQNPEYQKVFSMALIVNFLQTMRRLHLQCSHLLGLHSKFIEHNEGYLLLSQSRTSTSVQEATIVLAELINPKQPIQYKYKLAKVQLEQRYVIIENQIKDIKIFEQIYARHSNRVKKVLIMQILYFLHLEKLYMNESDFIKSNSVENFVQSNSQTQADRNNQANRQENQEQKEQNVSSPELFHIDNIYTGQYLTQEYLKTINRFLFAAYSEWKNSQFFKQTLTKQLYIMLNKDQNQRISQVNIENLELTGFPPEILWIRQLHSEPFQFLADLSLAFKGKLIIYLKTECKLMAINIPTEVKVEVQQLYCVIRLCFVPSEKGQSWFSFIGEPIAKFTVEPKIYAISINVVETIRNFFSNLLLKKLKQSTFPIRQKIMIPVSKEDLMLQMIQKRFRSGYQF